MSYYKPVELNRARFAGINEWQLFGIILLVNLIQSWFTPLINDEPYYWVYAQYLSTGYFDHPPLIGWLIRLTSSWLPGEIGVRLAVTLLGSCTFFILYRLIKKEAGGTVNFKWLALLLSSSLFLNVYSFLAVPDTPMLFFSVLFLYVYRRYLTDDGWKSTIALGLISALLLYAKYHGLLLIGFTLLSNPKLLTKRSFYVMAGMVVLLLLPHAYWQVQHHFASLKFHLLNRETDFKLKHIFSYTGEQLAVTGPVILLLFSIIYRPKNQFQRTLKFNVIGTFLFFFISAFKKNVNVHWTGIAFPAMLCLAYLYIIKLKTHTRLIATLLGLNLMLIILLRINVIFNWIRIPHFNELNPKVMLAKLQQKSGGRPLVFEDMYNEPSFFMFYQHQPSFAVNTVNYKKTQYNYLHQLENQFQGKAVCLITKYPVNNKSVMVTVKKGRNYAVTPIDTFASFTSVNILAPGLKSFYAGGSAVVPVAIQSSLSQADQHLFELQHGYLALTLLNKQTHQAYTFKYTKPVNLTGEGKAVFEFTVPALNGEYNCVFSVMTDNSLAPVFNSDIYKVDIK